MDGLSAADGTAPSDRDVSSLCDSRSRAEAASLARVPALDSRLLTIVSSDGCSNTDNKDLGKVGAGTLGAPSFTLHSTRQQVLATDDQAEKGLWETVERVMASRRPHVQRSLEEFGIVTDVPLNSDPLEEQMWRVVQGELNVQEMADLV